jgi:ribosomal protein L21E
MGFSWNTPNKNRKTVAKQLSTFKEKDVVKLIDCNNSRKGLDKNGRTGIVTRVEGNQYEVQLHCTTTGGNDCKTVFVPELCRFVGLTNVKQWFDAKQLQKVTIC